MSILPSLCAGSVLLVTTDPVNVLTPIANTAARIHSSRAPHILLLPSSGRLSLCLFALPLFSLPLLDLALTLLLSRSLLLLPSFVSLLNLLRSLSPPIPAILCGLLWKSLALLWLSRHPCRRCPSLNWLWIYLTLRRLLRLWTALWLRTLRLARLFFILSFITAPALRTRINRETH